MTDYMTLETMQRRAFVTAAANGFWEEREDPDDYIPKCLALIHSEVSEALEAHRVGDMEEFGEELADIIIRIGDLAEHEGFDLTREIQEKMEKNEGRSYRHGKKY